MAEHILSTHRVKQREREKEEIEMGKEEGERR